MAAPTVSADIPLAELGSAASPPNSVPVEIYNLLILTVVFLLIAWFIRLCRLTLMVHDLKLAVAGGKVLKVDGINARMATIRSLMRHHLRQFLRTQHQVPMREVPRYAVPFLVQKVQTIPADPRLATEADPGAPTTMCPAVRVFFRSHASCCIQAFWGLDAGALRRLDFGLKRVPAAGAATPAPDADSNDAVTVPIVRSRGWRGQGPRYNAMPEMRAMEATPRVIEMTSVSGTEPFAQLFEEHDFVAQSKPAFLEPGDDLTYEAQLPFPDPSRTLMTYHTPPDATSGPLQLVLLIAKTTSSPVPDTPVSVSLQDGKADDTCSGSSSSSILLYIVILSFQSSKSGGNVVSGSVAEVGTPVLPITPTVDDSAKEEERLLAATPSMRSPMPGASEAGTIFDFGTPTIEEERVLSRKSNYLVQEVFGLDGADEECVVCLSERKSIILLPCRHFAVCAACFAHLDKCPVCRSSYQSHLVVATAEGGLPAEVADDSASATGGGASGGAAHDFRAVPMPAL